MTRLTISLPKQMSDYINRQTQSGQYGNVSEYIRTLIRNDQEGRLIAIEEMKKMIVAAEKSGISKLTLSEIKHKARKQLGL